MTDTTAEMLRLHVRDGVHNPLTFQPIPLPPIAAALTVDASLRRRRARSTAKPWLGITAALGVAWHVLADHFAVRWIDK